MKVLVVVDMQNDFIDGALGTNEAKAIVEKVKNKITEYRNNKDEVIFTRDTHSDEYFETQEGKMLPVMHCVNETKGWEITNKLPINNSKVIDKISFGSFELAEYIDSIEGLEQIELIGLCTDICVISNAMILKAKCTEVPIIVDSSCCAGVTSETHNNALEAMKMCQIIIK